MLLLMSLQMTSSPSCPIYIHTLSSSKIHTWSVSELFVFHKLEHCSINTLLLDEHQAQACVCTHIEEGKTREWVSVRSWNVIIQRSSLCLRLHVKTSEFAKNIWRKSTVCLCRQKKNSRSRSGAFHREANTFLRGKFSFDFSVLILSSWRKELGKHEKKAAIGGKFSFGLENEKKELAENRIGA